MEQFSYSIHQRTIMGHLGYVYRATEYPSEHEVAIVILDQRRVPEASWENLRENLIRVEKGETPNLCSVRSIFRHEEVYGIVHPWLSGLTVAQMVELVGAFPVPLIRQFCLEIGAVLSRLHHAGRYHSRVRADEVVLTEDLSFQLSNPLLSRFLADIRAPISDEESRLTEEGLQQSFDIFFIGLLLYQMATGMQPPVEEDAWGADPDFLQNTMDPGILYEDFSPRLRRIILKAVTVRSGNGFSSMDQLLGEVEALPEEPFTGLELGHLRQNILSLGETQNEKALDSTKVLALLDSLGEDELFLPAQQEIFSGNKDGFGQEDSSSGQYGHKDEEDTALLKAHNLEPMDILQPIIMDTPDHMEAGSPGLESLDEEAREVAAPEMDVPELGTAQEEDPVLKTGEVGVAGGGESGDESPEDSPGPEPSVESGESDPVDPVEPAPDTPETGASEDEDSLSSTGILQGFLAVRGVQSVLLVARDGFVIEFAGDVARIDLDGLGASIAIEFIGIDRVANELDLQAWQSATFEYEGTTIYCRPVGEAFLAIVAADSRSLGAIRHQAGRWVEPLAKLL